MAIGSWRQAPQRRSRRKKKKAKPPGWPVLALREGAELDLRKTNSRLESINSSIAKSHPALFDSAEDQQRKSLDNPAYTASLGRSKKRLAIVKMAVNWGFYK